MRLIRHYAAALIIFSMLFTLYNSMYSVTREYYGFTNTYEGDGADGGGSLGERIEALGLIHAYDNFVNGVYKVVNPSGITDIIGGLMSTAFGTLQLFFETIFLPINVFSIILGFYPIPSVISTGVGILIVIYIAFIYLSSRLRSEI